jgi:murein DD-endopeptidase MepM/ murein hydrolase activator NlpD
VQFGWGSWLKTVGVTAGVTSAFWIVLGGWLWHSHLENGPVSDVSAVSNHASGAAQVAKLGAGGLAIPVAGVRREQLSDNFTQPREDGARKHEALDIMAPEGTAVLAAAPGRVEKLFVSERGGNTIYERSPDGTTIYYYAHLAGYAPGLIEGAHLRPGDPIGTVGHTGDADPGAPHLHFAVWRTSPERHWWDDTTAVDPYPLLTGRPAPDPAK